MPVRTIEAFEEYWSKVLLGLPHINGRVIDSAKAGFADQGIQQDRRMFSSAIKKLSRGHTFPSRHMISLD